MQHMTDAESAEWIAFHKALFHLHTVHDEAMLAEWTTLFSDCSKAEMMAASRALAVNPDKEARFRANHSQLLRSWVMAERYRRDAAEREQLERMGSFVGCKECLGTGGISVPHPGGIVNGQWTHPFFTLFVACRCNRGAMRLNGANSGLQYLAEKRGVPVRRMTSIEEYEALHDDWQTLVSRREQTRVSRWKAQYHAGEADKVSPLKEIVARVGTVP